MSDINKILDGFSKEKNQLIKALQTIQKNDGYISDNTITQTADFFGISAVEIEGVVSFYSQFKRKKPGKLQIAVCDGTACHIKGAVQITGWIAEEIGINPGETDSDGLFSLEEVACLGCCSLAPVISVNQKVYGNLTRKDLRKTLKKIRREGTKQ